MDSDLQDDLEDWRLRHRPVALAVGRVIEGEREVCWTGSRSLGSCQPIDESTRFRVASISKVITTLLLLRLSQRGVIDLDAPASRYLSSFQLGGIGHDATVRELMSHTAGLGLIRNVHDLRMSRSFGPPAYRNPPVDPVRFYAPILEISATAGTIWSYGNHGHSVVGQVAADATGLSFADVVNVEVLRPLGMSDSGFSIESNLAQGYNQSPLYGYRPVRRRRFVATPAGEFVTNLTDFMRLAEALAANEGGFLDAAHHRMLFTPQPLRSGENVPFAGLSFRLRHLGSQLVAVHGGRHCGSSAFLIVDFEHRAAAFSLSTGIKLPAARAIAERAMCGFPHMRVSRDEMPGSPVLPEPGIYRLRRAGAIPNLHGRLATGGLIEVSVREDTFSFVSPIGAYASGGSAVPFSAIEGRYRYVKRRGRPEEAQVTSGDSGQTVIWVLPALLMFDHVDGAASPLVRVLIAFNRLRVCLRAKAFRQRVSRARGGGLEPLGAVSAVADPPDA